MRVDEDQDLPIATLAIDQALDLSQNSSDARKVVSPWYQDSLSVHPDANHHEVTLQSTCMADHVESSGVLDKVKNFGNWLWGLVFPSSQTEKQDGRDSTTAPGTVQTHDTMTQQEYQHFIDEMRQMVRRIKEHNEEFGAEQNFEALLCQIFKAQIEDREAESLLHWEQIAQDLEDKRHLNRERMEKLDEVIDKQKTAQYWGHFDKIAAGLGITAAGLAVSSGVGAAIFLVGVGLTADSMMDDWTKRKLVGLVTDDQQKQDQYTEYLKLGAGICTVAIFMGLGGQQTLQTAVSVAKGGATIGQGVTSYGTDTGHAAVKELSNQIEKKDNKLKRDNGRIKSLVENVHEYYRNLSEVQRNQMEAATALIRA